LESRAERDKPSSLADTMPSEGSSSNGKAARIFAEGIVRGVEMGVEGSESAVMATYEDMLA